MKRDLTHTHPSREHCVYTEASSMRDHIEGSVESGLSKHVQFIIPLLGAHLLVHHSMGCPGEVTWEFIGISLECLEVCVSTEKEFLQVKDKFLPCYLTFSTRDHPHTSQGGTLSLNFSFTITAMLMMWNTED